MAEANESKFQKIASAVASVVVLAGMLLGIIYGVRYFANNTDTTIKLPKNMTESSEEKQPSLPAGGINQNTAGAGSTQETGDANKEPQVQYAILAPGSGSAAKDGDKVTVHYTGTLTDGTKFDSSIDRGQPFSFTLGGGEVIKGWEMGVSGMKIGEKRKLVIPSEYGYGAEGTPGGPIPPNATLIFEIELLKIN